jgi:hypothetical protein
MLFAASFFISVYYAYQRTWKPFNPILGETYEMANHGGMSFIAEQVCLMSCLFSFLSYFKENADFTKFTCLSLSSIFFTMPLEYA